MNYVSVAWSPPWQSYVVLFFKLDEGFSKLGVPIKL